MIEFTTNRSLSQLPAVGQVIILSSYDLPEDEKVCRLFEQLFPSLRIASIDCRQIARDGGVLNCVSWNVSNKTPILG
jgi:agmatine deiminase